MNSRGLAQRTANTEFRKKNQLKEKQVKKAKEKKAY